MEELTIEAVSEDISLNVRGEEMAIRLVDKLIDDENALVLITKYNVVSFDEIKTTWILVDNNKVLQINNSKGLPKIKEGYIVIGRGLGAEFLNKKFKNGDIVKLRLNDEITDIDSIVNKIYAYKEDFIIKGNEFITVNSNEITTSIELIGLKNDKEYKIQINEKSYKAEGSMLDINLNLALGVNNFTIKLMNGNLELTKKYLIVYRRIKEIDLKDNILWIDQFPSALMLNTVEDIDNILSKAKKVGFTACAIDVKGPEGYVSYKKNELSNSPYISEIKVQHKKGMNPHRDMFSDFLNIAKKYGLKVYAAINVMTEGNLTAKDYPLIDSHKDWEEVIQRPEDKGKLVSVRESKANNILLYINPANDEAINYQLLRYEEVLKNYDVDGVILDRCRYDNCYADFSDITREKFSEYLKDKGKTLEKWPDDVFKIQENGLKIEGQHYLEWWTFRSGIIKEIASKIRNLVNRYSNIKSKKIEFASYVGSWYDVIYENGINWASKDFRYNKALGFGEERIYTEEYYNTSYIEHLDFIMIGTYYKTSKEIAKHITIGNILTMEEISMIAGMSIPDLGQGLMQKEVYKTAMDECNGTMTFDLSYIDWKGFELL